MSEQEKHPAHEIGQEDLKIESKKELEIAREKVGVRESEGEVFPDAIKFAKQQGDKKLEGALRLEQKRYKEEREKKKRALMKEIEADLILVGIPKDLIKRAEAARRENGFDLEVYDSYHHPGADKDNVYSHTNRKIERIISDKKEEWKSDGKELTATQARALETALLFGDIECDYHNATIESMATSEEEHEERRKRLAAKARKIWEKQEPSQREGWVGIDDKDFLDSLPRFHN